MVLPADFVLRQSTASGPLMRLRSESGGVPGAPPHGEIGDSNSTDATEMMGKIRS